MISLVAAIFNLDIRTVRRYYKVFGRGRIGRAIRFFENRIMSRSDADFHFKENDSPKRWKGQVWMAGKMAAVKWFGSTKADQRAAIAWEEQTKKDLVEAKKLQTQTPTDSSPVNKVSILEWANAYLEECERRNTASTFKEKRDGFRRFMKYLATTEKLSQQMRVEDFGRREAHLYLTFQ